MDTDLELYQAKMILNALKDGWTVKMVSDGTVEFTKEKESHMEEENYSHTFLDMYGKIKKG